MKLHLAGEGNADSVQLWAGRQFLEATAHALRKGARIHEPLPESRDVRASLGMVQADQPEWPGARARSRRQDHHRIYGDLRIPGGPAPRRTRLASGRLLRPRTDARVDEVGGRVFLLVRLDDRLASHRRWHGASPRRRGIREDGRPRPAEGTTGQMAPRARRFPAGVARRGNAQNCSFGQEAGGASRGESVARGRAIYARRHLQLRDRERHAERLRRSREREGFAAPRGLDSPHQRAARVQADVRQATVGVGRPTAGVSPRWTPWRPPSLPTREVLERETRLELATSTLARLRGRWS